MGRLGRLSPLIEVTKGHTIRLLYGDGTPIDKEYLESALVVAKWLQVLVKWQETDVVLLDNMLHCIYVPFGLAKGWYLLLCWMMA
ncbi:hypothetical protein F5Y06DRAFT_218281 [Hypoxylon sp. FL0890]|nr:hypothetical protein F5Y06DRAFT_218281 [Hypoxylon sp. FL0890]